MGHYNETQKLFIKKYQVVIKKEARKKGYF